MRRRLPLVLLTPCLGCLVALACAAPPDEPASPDAPAKKANPTSFVSLLRERSGQQTVMIHYRWKLHSDASVEVRLAPADAASAAVAPLYFVGEYFKGDVSRKVFHCLDAADHRETADSFSKDKIDFQILGQQNSLGRPAILVLPCQQVENAHGKEAGSPDSPKAVFLLLDSWALDDETLNLDLPRQRFADPGLLHVWFLRSNRALWEETVPWPGYRKKAEGGKGKAEGKAKDEG